MYVGSPKHHPALRYLLRKQVPLHRDGLLRGRIALRQSGQAGQSDLKLSPTLPETNPLGDSALSCKRNYASGFETLERDVPGPKRERLKNNRFWGGSIFQRRLKEHSKSRQRTPFDRIDLLYRTRSNSQKIRPKMRYLVNWHHSLYPADWGPSVRW
jgi:hypothetical protein